MSWTTPKWLKQHLFEYDPAHLESQRLDKIREGLSQYLTDQPKISIVLPAYNEEKQLLNTLSSFSKMDLDQSTELIVANNNSTDQTESILESLKVKTIFEKRRGISYARQAGLEKAKGEIVLNADADSIYPPNWVRIYAEAFNDKNLACAYGHYHFIPGKYATRYALHIYESLSQLKFNSRHGKDECKNVMGFNFAFRRELALQIGGFKHDLDRENTGRSEDGWMAWELFPLGALKKVPTTVWTGTRRLEEDGPIWQAFIKRALHVLK